MEKMSWPSERIAHGGIFHQRNVNYSRETHDMIKSKRMRKPRGNLIFNVSFVSLPFHPAYLPSSISINGRGQFDNDATQ